VTNLKQVRQLSRAPTCAAIGALPRLLEDPRFHLGGQRLRMMPRLESLQALRHERTALSIDVVAKQGSACSIMEYDAPSASIRLTHGAAEYQYSVRLYKPLAECFRNSGHVPLGATPLAVFTNE
jgi:hypothetical protein